MEMTLKLAIVFAYKFEYYFPGILMLIILRLAFIILVCSKFKSIIAQVHNKDEIQIFN